jgi:hypothetical protein
LRLVFGRGWRQRRFRASRSHSRRAGSHIDGRAGGIDLSRPSGSERRRTSRHDAGQALRIKAALALPQLDPSIQQLLARTQQKARAARLWRREIAA